MVKLGSAILVITKIDNIRIRILFLLEAVEMA